jgi:tRNA G26 N,N-dimethylase Trm1
MEYATRELVRSVRHISKAADLMSRDHLLLNLDSLPKWSGTTGAPKMEVLIQSLIEKGHSAARAPDSEPVFVTDATFQDVVEIVQDLSEKSAK